MADKMMRMAGRGTDGTAKPIATNDQGQIRTSEFRKLGSSPFATGGDQLQKTVPVGETLVLLTNTNAIKLEGLVWVTDNLDLQLTIKKLDGAGGSITIGDLLSAGSGGDNARLTPRIINAHGISLFKTNIFKTNDYKFSLAQPLDFPRGLQIEVQNIGSVPASVSVRGYGVIFL